VVNIAKSKPGDMKKILMIDDDKDFVESVTLFLKKHGYTVEARHSCEDGFLGLASFKPNLILLDVNVNDQDGRDLCKKIKAVGEYRHIPVILISADHERLAFYPDFGADAAIKKPFQPGVLLEVLQRFL
jgi:two-component system alkaline phosphatase synthesis response regulator PhoP/two-component system response regulator MprA